MFNDVFNIPIFCEYYESILLPRIHHSDLFSAPNLITTNDNTIKIINKYTITTSDHFFTFLFYFILQRTHIDI